MIERTYLLKGSVPIVSYDLMTNWIRGDDSSYHSNNKYVHIIIINLLLIIISTYWVHSYVHHITVHSLYFIAHRLTGRIMFIWTCMKFNKGMSSWTLLYTTYLAISLQFISQPLKVAVPPTYTRFFHFEHG